MSFNVLGVNLSHNSSIALVSDKKLVFYLEEERLSRIKRDNSPYFLLKKYLSSYKIDKINFVNAGETFLSDETLNLLNKIFSFTTTIPHINNYTLHHHLTHAYCSFIHSGFKKSNNIVIDTGGSVLKKKQECESIFYFDKNNLNFNKIYKNYNVLNKSVGITKTYVGVGDFFGIGMMDGGKLMGLSSYGKKDSSLPKFFIKGKSNYKIIKNNNFNSVISKKKELNIKHLNFIKEIKNQTLSQKGRNIAYHIQQESQEEIAKLIEKALQINNCKNITISGGFGLNCVNNYYLIKRFPNVNFYFEPISHDGGTAIGAAYLGYNNISSKLKSLYLGPKYSKQQLLKKIKNYVDN